MTSTIKEQHIKLVEEHRVIKAVPCTRLQEYAVNVFNSIPTKSGLKKAIKKNLVYVNNKIASTAYYVQEGDIISLYQNTELPKALDKLKLPLKIYYEDAYLAIIEKPPGVLVSGNTFVSIYNALPQNLQQSTMPDAMRPTPVHRLDYPTSGLLLIGKTGTCTRALYKLFEEKKIQKTYYAISIGKMPIKGVINSPIDTKDASSYYIVEKSVVSKRFEYLNLVKLTPITGRKHQLRKHLHHIGNPILGDRDYFLEGKLLKGKGLYLHANSLKFTHPITKKEIHIISELPKKFRKIFY